MGKRTSQKKNISPKKILCALVAAAAIGYCAYGRTESLYEKARRSPESRERYLTEQIRPNIPSFVTVEYDPDETRFRSYYQSRPMYFGIEACFDVDPPLTRAKQRPPTSQEVNDLVCYIRRINYLAFCPQESYTFATKKTQTIFIKERAFTFSTPDQPSQTYEQVFHSAVSHELLHAKDAYEGFRIGATQIDNLKGIALFSYQLLTPIGEMRAYHAQINELARTTGGYPHELITTYKRHRDQLISTSLKCPETIGNINLKNLTEEFLREEEKDQDFQARLNRN